MRKVVSFLLAVVLVGCGEPPFPKPHGYPRIELPQQGYELWDSNCPFSFKKPVAAKMEFPYPDDSCYFNIAYPSINAKLHISYAPVNGRLKGLIDNEYKLREKHNQFSTSVKERVFRNAEKKVNALLFNISGTKAATPLQFFITDSVNHFFRGVLYFNTSPDNDSLATAINFIRADVDTLVESFRWEN